MPENLVTVIDSLTDVQVVAAVRQLNRRVFAGVSISALTPAAGAVGLEPLADGVAAAKLDPATSVDMSRRLLRAFASDAALAPLVRDIVAAVQQDDSLFIETAVALGLLVNLTIFMASSDVTFKSGALTVKKGRVGADVIKAIVEPVVELIKKLPGV